MPYVQRDSSGQVSAIFQKPQKNAEELLPNDHQDIQNFFGGILPQTENKNAAPPLPESDIGLIRVIEDLVDALIDKNIIMFTDLPVSAREKILFRKSIREKLSNPVGIVNPAEDIF
jgi:hypothetical protein